VRVNNGGRYECAYCGAVLDITFFDKPRVTSVAASGAPNVRKLILSDRVIHACAIAHATATDDR
jgi:hypothetical protein